jgi:hypothetical protein
MMDYYRLLRGVRSDDYEVLQSWYEDITSYEFNYKISNLTGNRLVDEYEEEEIIENTSKRYQI